MNTDRELLELAAKAAGIPLTRWCPKGTWDEEPELEGWMDATCNFWNPLVDDGDALRLAVNLSILCYVGETHDKGKMAVATLMYHTPHFEALEDANTDKYAAIRRAIVIAAAEIGKRKYEAT